MRTYKRKTSRGSASDQLGTAARAVLEDGKSVNAAAEEFGVKRMTLTRYLKKVKTADDTATMGYEAPRKVFTSDQEIALKVYLSQMAFLFHRYTSRDIRRLAYVCGVKFGIKIPTAWTTNKIAGKDWLIMFLKRNPELSIWRPDPTSNGQEKAAHSQEIEQFLVELVTVEDANEYTNTECE